VSAKTSVSIPISQIDGTQQGEKYDTETEYPAPAEEKS